MSTSTNPPEACTAAAANSAVARCCDAYAQTFRLVAAVKDQASNASYEAKEAYQRAMPPLDSPENIRDFIACVPHCILIEAISGSDGARLLYAAQVAHTALNAPSQIKKPAPAPVSQVTPLVA